MSEKPRIEIELNDAATPPKVGKGGIGYFLVFTGAGKRAFGAHYLDEYKLIPRDDCPDATAENGFTPCQSCENCDGHPYSGWYEETEDGDGEVFQPLDMKGEYAIKLWAEMPENPLLANREPKP